MTDESPPKSPTQYDVCLSFAGEDRSYVRRVARALKRRGIRIFYDEYEVVELWGKDLYEHLEYVYRKSAQYCVVFASRHYANKIWTNHERKSAQARAINGNIEYILPVRFDDSEIPGVRSTVGYVDATSVSASNLALYIIKKLEPSKLLEFHHRVDYFPPEPDILLEHLGASTNSEIALTKMAARAFYVSLTRMSEDERFAVGAMFIHSCPHDYPENVHAELDLIRRVLEWPTERVRSALSNLSSIGFHVEFPRQSKSKKSDISTYLRFGVYNDSISHLGGDTSNFTNVGIAICEILSRHYCATHCLRAFVNRNFSALSTATASPDVHE